jgi:RecA/RadA recombinase
MSEKKAKKPTDSDKIKALNNALVEIRKTYKNDNLIRSASEMPPIRKVRTNEPSLDYALSGGIPIGRITEFLGAEHSGKTRNALRALSQFQKYCFNCHSHDAIMAEWEKSGDNLPELVSCECKYCDNGSTRINVFIDYEGTTDQSFMEIFGIDYNGVLYLRPDRPSTTADVMDMLIRQEMIGLMILDSLGGMGSDKEVDTRVADEKMNQNALFFNKMLRKFQAALNYNTNLTGEENGITLLIINQSYTTLDFYSKSVPVGGRGLRHFKGMSLKTTIIETTRNKRKEKVGVHVRVENMKNKTGIPFRKGEYYLNLNPRDFYYDYCMTNVDHQLADLAIAFKIADQRGAWIYYKNHKWNGRSKFEEAAKTLTELRDDVYEYIDKSVIELANVTT